MSEAWPAPQPAARGGKVLPAATVLGGAVLSGVAPFLPWERSCADLGRFAPAPVCTSVPGIRAGGALAVLLVIGALAAAMAILALRGAIPTAPVVGLGLASATVVLGVLEVANGSFSWGVWPWIAGGGLQAGGHAWSLIRAHPPERSP